MGLFWGRGRMRKLEEGLGRRGQDQGFAHRLDPEHPALVGTYPSI